MSDSRIREWLSLQPTSKTNWKWLIAIAYPALLAVLLKSLMM